ncbi:MAG: glycosyltransferase family 4 protein [bacterium]|nr:glycosyltransferase family 4 protein [bacterium]
MKIAFIGQKGIPATWGGIEVHVDELARRLAARGHQVTVYVRSWYTPRNKSEIRNPKSEIYEGVRLVHTPTWKTKHLDALIHSFIATIHAVFQGYEIIHYHAIGPAFFCWIPKLLGKKVVVTIHRFDYLAAKWGGFARKSLRVAEKFALRIPHKTIVVARHQQDHYQVQGYPHVRYIPNGVPILDKLDPEIIQQKYGLQKNSYLFFAGRLTPEKRVDWLITAYKKLIEQDQSSLKLVIAGGSSATDAYETELHHRAQSFPGIIFTGYVQGKEKQELFSNAKLFILPSAVEGLPIALLEGMSYGLPCLASDIPPHREVIQNRRTGYLFAQDSESDLLQQLKNILAKSEEELVQLGSEAKKKVALEYDWNNIVIQTEKVYTDVIHS